MVVLEDGKCVEWEFLPLAYFDVFSKRLIIDVNTFTHTNVDNIFLLKTFAGIIFLII